MNDFSWIGPTLKLVASGALETIIIAVASVVIAGVLGVLLGVLLCLPAGRRNNAVRWGLTLYLQLFRGLPVLVTLFIVFFVSPSLGLDLASTPATIAGLSLWGSANVMEVVRGAVRSIPTAQFEAATALGFKWAAVMRLVVLPQASRRMIPPVVNLIVDLIQATTLASLIGVVEVLQRSRQAVEYYQLSAGDGHAAPIFAGVLLFFFVICYPLTIPRAGWRTGPAAKHRVAQSAPEWVDESPSPLEPKGMTGRSDAVVIGAGIVGCSVAFALAQRGHQVTVLDSGPGVAAGTTSSSTAVIRFHYSYIDAVTLASNRRICGRSGPM